MQKHLLSECVGANIRAIRKRQNLSQSALAELTNLDRNTIAQIERGERSLTGLAQVVKLTEALGAHIEEVFQGILS